MRSVLGLIVGSLLLLGVAAAQEAYPAVRVAELARDSVVSIDSNVVAFGAVTGVGALELSRQTRLLTNRLTGFIYTENGYIITDSQDIEDATLLKIHLDDGTELDGEVIGVDTEYGVGVVKVESEDPLKPVVIMDTAYDPLGDVYPYDQGDVVVAIGYSGGYGGTVTAGIISAVRNFRNSNYMLIPSVIQADVVINAGNEGCPLFNDRGEVIAMHDRRGGGGSMQQTTFFIPVWLVARVADEIIANYESNKPVEDYEIWHPWLGIKPFAGSISPMTGFYREVGDDLKMYMDIPDQYWDVGILLDRVWTESPAREYGLLDHDMLLDLTVLYPATENDPTETVRQPYMLLTSIQELELLVTTAGRDEIFEFGVLRNRTYFKVKVIVGQHPGSFSFEGFDISSDYF